MELLAIHPKMSFIIGAIDKEIRLSFAQRIRGTLPDPYQDLITEGKEKDIPDFKYSIEGEFSVLPVIVNLKDFLTRISFSYTLCE